MKFSLDSASLNSMSLDELSRRELVHLAEDLVYELEKTRSELSESVRSEVNLKFEIDRIVKLYREVQKEASNG